MDDNIGKSGSKLWSGGDKFCDGKRKSRVTGV